MRASRLATASGALGTVLLLFALFFLAVACIAGSRGFWAREYEKLGNAEAMGMESRDLTAATMQMIYYMQGRAPSIDLEVTVDGEVVSMFNDRERAHMVDVAVLYQNLRTAAWIAGGLGLLLLLPAVFSRPARPLRASLIGGGAFLALVGIIGGYAAHNFQAFWTAFHHVFFTNDLWLLDPRTSRMINMMPLELFSDVVLYVALLFLGFTLALFLAEGLWGRLRNREAG